MNVSTFFGLGEAHALALLKRLQRNADDVPSAETCRLYFVDVDVLSAYINGGNGDMLSAWSSLFSLTPDVKPKNEAEVDPFARSMADATARSVSGFLMGRFREGRSLQSARLWLTPEHLRELDSMIHAILREVHEELVEWQDAVLANYQAIPASLDDPAGREDALQRFHEIFKSLRSNSVAGKIARAYDVRRRMTSVLSQAPVFTPPELKPAFMLRADTSAFERRAKEIASLALSELKVQLKSKQRDESFWPAIERALEIAFDTHRPNLKIADYERRAQDDATLKVLVPRTSREPKDWIAQAVRIAAIQVSDMFALGRLVTLGEVLSRDHPLPKPYEWRVCLISGASMLEFLLRRLKTQQLGMNVEFVHPLSVMRFDEFVRPQDVADEAAIGTPSDALGDTPGEEYALAARGKPEDAKETLKADEFFKSLDALLSKLSDRSCK